MARPGEHLLLPVTFQFLIAMVAYAINERMARRLDFVQEEVRVLRVATQHLEETLAQRR